MKKFKWVLPRSTRSAGARRTRRNNYDKLSNRVVGLSLEVHKQLVRVISS